MKALRLFLFFFIVTGILYPLTITLFAYLFFNESAIGSIIYKEDKAIGSKLLAQEFKETKYFYSRPSSSKYSALPSTGSNLGPNSKILKEIVSKADKSLPLDLIFQSGSGLDPHITKESALFQAKRVASSRNMDEKILIKQIEDLTEYGSYVNVLLLNLSLDGYAR